MASDAALFVYIAMPVRWPVLASTSFWYQQLKISVSINVRWGNWPCCVRFDDIKGRIFVFG